MIAMLRATARASVGDRWHSFSGLALVGTIPVLGFLPLSGVGPAALLFCAIQLLFVGFLGMHLRGRAIGPGGMPTLAGPMPMLPVSRTKRVTAVVVVGEVLLLGVSVGIWALRWVIVSGTGVADSQWERSVLGPQPFAFTLATWALAWAPLLAAGSEGGVEMGGGRALLYGVGFMGLAM